MSTSRRSGSRSRPPRPSPAVRRASISIPIWNWHSWHTGPPIRARGTPSSPRGSSRPSERSGRTSRPPASPDTTSRNASSISMRFGQRSSRGSGPTESTRESRRLSPVTPRSKRRCTTTRTCSSWTRAVPLSDSRSRGSRVRGAPSRLSLKCPCPTPRPRIQAHTKPLKPTAPRASKSHVCRAGKRTWVRGEWSARSRLELDDIQLGKLTLYQLSYGRVQEAW